MSSFFDQSRVTIAKQRIEDIVHLTKEHHYELACAKWMENVIYVHTGQVTEQLPIEHPNGYTCTLATALVKKE